MREDEPDQCLLVCFAAEIQAHISPMPLGPRPGAVVCHGNANAAVLLAFMLHLDPLGIAVFLIPNGFCF